MKMTFFALTERSPTVQPPPKKGIYLSPDRYIGFAAKVYKFCLGGTVLLRRGVWSLSGEGGGAANRYAVIFQESVGK